MCIKFTATRMYSSKKFHTPTILLGFQRNGKRKKYNLKEGVTKTIVVKECEYKPLRNIDFGVQFKPSLFFSVSTLCSVVFVDYISLRKKVKGMKYLADSPHKNVRITYELIDFGENIHDVYPLYEIFSKDYQYEGILGNIMKFLSYIDLVKGISNCSKYTNQVFKRSEITNPWKEYIEKFEGKISNLKKILQKKGFRRKGHVVLETNAVYDSVYFSLCGFEWVGQFSIQSNDNRSFFMNLKNSNANFYIPMSYKLSIVSLDDVCPPGIPGYVHVCETYYPQTYSWGTFYLPDGVKKSVNNLRIRLDMTIAEGVFPYGKQIFTKEKFAKIQEECVKQVGLCKLTKIKRQEEHNVTIRIDDKKRLTYMLPEPIIVFGVPICFDFYPNYNGNVGIGIFKHFNDSLFDDFKPKFVVTSDRGSISGSFGILRICKADEYRVEWKFKISAEI